MKEHLSEINSICITGTVSPEGSLQHNIYLAGIRYLRIAREFTDIIDKKTSEAQYYSRGFFKIVWASG